MVQMATQPSALELANFGSAGTDSQEIMFTLSAVEQKYL